MDVDLWIPLTFALDAFLQAEGDILQMATCSQWFVTIRVTAKELQPLPGAQYVLKVLSMC
jgi:hypothetical protein